MKGFERTLVAVLVLLGVVGLRAAEVEVRYRREMNVKNWRRGIIEDCESSSTFQTEFLEEGEAYTLDGYVQKEGDKFVSEKSGVFVSIAVDLGSKSPKWLDELLVPKKSIDEQLIIKLTPYLGLVGQAAENKLKQAPLQLTEAEEQRFAEAVKTRVFSQIQDVYNKFKSPSAVEFSKLSLTLKTIIMSLYSQQASFLKPDFKEDRQVAQLRNSITKGLLSNDFSDFKDDIKELGVLTRYHARRKKEVDLYESVDIKCQNRLQAMFVVDESGSIGPENFELAKSTVIEFIKLIPDNKSFFGVMFYNDEQTIAVPYEELSNRAAAEEKVNKHNYNKGATATGEAISHALKLVEPKRLALNPQIYVITDGKSNDSVLAPAKTARDKKLILNAVGIGESVYEPELKDIAFDLSHWSVMKSYKQMKCNVKQFVSNICFQADLKEIGDEIKVDVDEKANVVFGVKVPKTSNLRVTIKNTKKDEILIYGALNIENPDELVSDYFHSGNSEIKTVVFKWRQEALQPKPQPRALRLSQEHLETEYEDNVSEFTRILSEMVTQTLHEPNDKLVIGKTNHIPNLENEHYYAFINIHSKYPRNIQISFEKCNDGEKNCIEGTNDETRYISKFWYFIPVAILLVLALLFLVRKRRSPSVEAEEQYRNI